jgi:RND family efflux transporter MFP subunit
MGAEQLADKASHWSQLVVASDTEAFAQSWLTLMCEQLPAADRALLLLGEPDKGPFTPAAVWPHDQSVVHLSDAAERVVSRRSVEVVEVSGGEAGPARQAIGFPVLLADVLHGVLVVQIRQASASSQQEIIRSLHWGAGALRYHLDRRQLDVCRQAKDRVFAVLDLVAVAIESDRFQGAATALATEIASRLGCLRVSVGLRRGRKLDVVAISDNATFGRQMNLVRLLGAAMDEAADQEAVVRYPSRDGRLVTMAQQALAQQQGAEEICTVPLVVRGRFDAALVLERPRDAPLSGTEIDFAQTVGEFASPMLLCKREDERWLIVKAWMAGRRQLQRLIGTDYLGRKLLLGMIVALGIFLFTGTGMYRLSADAILEAGERQAVFAQFNGFIAGAYARAGEIVERGQLLATLDDRDLKVEKVRLSTEIAQLRRERREATAQHERAQVRILNAKMDQIEAQIALIDEQLARTRVTAPFDGILVAGDLSQSLGAPVKQGDMLFELAPLGRYRLQLLLDERDIDDTVVGQHGSVVFSALPDRPLPITVQLITPITQVHEGRNAFTVEASLEQTPDRLRPGMEGVAKVEVGERRLVWIWTRGFLHWLRMKLWAWWP